MKSKAHNVYKNNNNRKEDLYSKPLIKQKIIDYIFNHIDISNYNFSVLRNKGDEMKIKNNKYLILPNFKGYNYLMVFIKNKERFYSCLIDRATLSYSNPNNKLDNIKIIPIDVYFDDINIYDGTIFDGIYYYENEKKYFIINDVYMFKGLSKKTDQIKNKLIEMNCYIKNNKNINNSIDISINSYYMFKDIKEAINDYQHNPDIRGIIFYPFLIDEYKQQKQTKLLYMFENNIEEIKNKKLINNSNDINLDINNINSSDMEITFENYKLKDNIDISNDIIFSFEVKKINEDIYNLSLLIPKDCNDLKNNIFIPKYISIAYLPTLEDSKKLRELFKNKSKLIMDCKYINIQNKTKWLPLNISSKKHPDLFNKFISLFTF